jgi:hypothetical protein
MTEGTLIVVETETATVVGVSEAVTAAPEK